jgi:transposase
MEQRIRRKFNDAFRAKVALEAAKGDRTIAEIASEYQVAASQVFAWRKQLLEGAPNIFSVGRQSVARSEDSISDPLLREIGRLQVENAFLKKKCLF